MTTDFTAITTENDLDKWVRENFRQVHGNAEIERKVYTRRSEIISGYVTPRKTCISCGAELPGYYFDGDSKTCYMC